MNWHQLKIEEIFKQTDSGEAGLSASEAKHRLHKVGPNELKEGKKKTIGGNAAYAVQGCNDPYFTGSSNYIRHHWRCD